MAVAPQGVIPPGLTRRSRRSRARTMAAACALVLGAGAVACSGSSSGDEPRRLEANFVPAPAGPSWAPRPQVAAGLDAVASVAGDRFLVHTEHGDVDFLPGVNLGATTPGHQPGEVAISREDVRRWLPLMGEIGIRSVRIYTILPPHFYDELAAYNADNEDAPLYLVQGVYLPDESYVESNDLFDEEATAAFTDEIEDAASAVHGDLERDPTPGRASGEWTTDVSPWLAGWIIGAELDPTAVAASDIRNADQPAHAGRYFANTPGSTPTSRWLAARMDEMAAADAERDHAAPVAFVNWPTLDPLRHPEEPYDLEDLVGIDANTIAATPAWPAGTFASYHAYPYYPDFLRHEPGLQVERNGVVDPYAAYLGALKAHHAGMPVMITEFGVPAALGSAHLGPLGRGQGGHSEQEAMAIDADLLRIIHETDLAGAFVFAWIDEWFKFTWNTVPRHLPADRRQFWHDPLTNEQYFGLVAADAVGGDDAEPTDIVDEPELTTSAATDESWVHLELELAEPPTGPVALAFDVVPGGAEVLPGAIASDGTADYAVVVDPPTQRAQAWVRAALDPVAYDNIPPPAPRPPTVDGWMPQQLALNRSQAIPTTGQRFPAEFLDVGVLRHGEMVPGAEGYDNRNTWTLAGRTLTLRIPWGLLGLADPSSKQALVPAENDDPTDDGSDATTVDVDEIGLTVHLGDQTIDSEGITWDEWDVPRYEERPKEALQVLVDAFAEVTPADTSTSTAPG